MLYRNPHIREKVLYGSDYQMTVQAGHFRTILADFTTTLGTDLIKLMSTDIVRRFPGL
jgi:hypothetical protein